MDPRSYESYMQRLESFTRAWPHSYDHRQNAHSMADAGFFYTGEGDRVQCPFCMICIEGWQYGQLPLEEHRQRTVEAARYVHCSYITGGLTLDDWDNVSEIDNTATPDDRFPDPERGTSQNAPGGIIFIQERTRADYVKAKSPAIPSQRALVIREKTFEKWPSGLKHLDTQAMANSGFFYTGN